MHACILSRFPCVLVGLTLFAWSVLCSVASAQVQVGDVADVFIESPHPYPAGTPERPAVWTHTIHHPGATFIKVHFASLRIHGSVTGGVAQGDYITIQDGSGVIQQLLSGGEEDERWARSVPGDTLTIALHADTTQTAFGLVIDRYGYGSVPLYPSILPKSESVCGADDRTPICQASDPGRIREADAVARIVWANDCGGMFLCTGFLFGAEGQFMTNAHCPNSASEAASMEVWFNYIDDATGPCALAHPNPDIFEGATFLQKNCDLDVAIHLIDDPSKGNPADTYGHLTLSEQTPTMAEAVWVPQHPGGRQKEIAEVNANVVSESLVGLNFCADPSSNCSFSGSTGQQTEFGYTADTEGGSSGSPVLDANSLVIGLHHAGGCGAVEGENAGILMSEIVPIIGKSVLSVKKLNLFNSGKLTLTGSAILLGGANIDPLTEAVNVVVRDVDGDIVNATIPIGNFSLKNNGTKWTFKDKSGTIAGGLTKLVLTFKGDFEYKVSVTGKNLDLSGADQAMVDVELGVGAEVIAANDVPCTDKNNKKVCK